MHHHYIKLHKYLEKGKAEVVKLFTGLSPLPNIQFFLTLEKKKTNKTMVNSNHGNKKVYILHII